MVYLVNWKYIPFVLLSDVIGNIFMFWTKFKKMPSSVNKVLFIRLEHIGDMVMATPCFETWKKNNPKCEVHVLCKTLTAPLLKNNPYVDKVIAYDAPWFSKRETDKNKKISDIIKELKKEKYDMTFEMHGDPRNNWLSFCIGSYSVGYGCRGGSFFLNKVIHYDANKHMIKQNLSLIEPFCKKIRDKPFIFSDKKSQDAAVELMRKNNLEKKKFVIINPCSGRKEKDLTNEEVNKFINSHKNTKIIITGSNSECLHNKVFDNLGKGKVINLTGKTDLLTLVELARFAKKVYAPDTGIIHIANAVSTEFECVYKITNKKVWGY